MPDTNDVPAGWWALLAAAIALLPVEGCVTFSLWFAPGWANGWPYPGHVVWSMGMAVLLFIGLMTVAVAAGAAYAIARYHSRTPGRTRRAFAVWISVSAAVTALLCVGEGYALSLRMAGKWNVPRGGVPLREGEASAEPVRAGSVNEGAISFADASGSNRLGGSLALPERDTIRHAV